jgi:hypothetical protein
MLIIQVEKIVSQLWIQYRNKIDRFIIYFRERWAVTCLLGLIYLVRVLVTGGFYVVSYVLGLYILHAFIKFISPVGIPDVEDEEEEEKYGEELPITNQ